VKSPGPCAAAGGGDIGGGAGEAVGVHAGAGGVEGVALHAGSCAGFAAAGLSFIELKMRVNSPGPCACAGGGAGAAGAGALGVGAEKILGAGVLGAGVENMLCAGALGAGWAGALGVASGAFIARNIAVKLPGSLPPGAAAGADDAGAKGAGAGGAEANGAGSTRRSGATAGKAGGVCPEAAIFSIGTGLKTLASSSLGRAGGAAIGSGVLSACSMRVNSPCPDAAGGGAGAAGGVGSRTGSALNEAPNELGGAGAGGADGNGTGSAPKMDGGAGAGAGAGAVGGGAIAAGSCGFIPRAASRSSSSCVGELGTLPKIPVALEAGLEGDPPPGSSDWGDWGGPKRSLIGSMRAHHLRENIAWFRNPRLHRLGLTVKGRQPTMQAHFDGSEVRARSAPQPRTPSRAHLAWNRSTVTFAKRFDC
jgi:hypothetical protein